MKNLFLVFALIYGTIAFASETIPADDTLIEYTGRIDFSDSTAPQFSYSGVSIRASFSGTSIAVIMDDAAGQNYFNILIDDNVVMRLAPSAGKATYTVTEDLTDTQHEIEIFKLTEADFGKTTFYGFVTDAGTTLGTLSERTRFIEYIGNSITCGYGNEGVNGEDSYSATTENHFMTYAAITSRSFNARHSAVCKSGIGVYRNYGQSASSISSNCMSDNYKRIFLYDESPEYDFSVTPDIVCINLGTNDFWDNAPDSAMFVSNYLRLIDTIQSNYDKPDIISLAGPMLWGTGLSTVKEYLDFIADSASNKGMGTVTWLELTAQSGTLGVDYHPSVEQHIGNAAELTEYISTLKGWEVTPKMIYSKMTTTNHLYIRFNTELTNIDNIATEFSLTGDAAFSFSSVYQDASDGSVLHFILNEEVAIDEDLEISYTAGTLQSTSSVSVESFTSPIDNTLETTEIESAYTSAGGSQITITLNKDINTNSVIDGLSLSDSEGGSIEIESYTLTASRIVLVPADAIRTGETIYLNYDGTGLTAEDNVALSNFTDYTINNKSTYTAVADIANVNISISPNPNTGTVFNYTITESFVGNGLSIQVINDTGLVVHKETVHSPEGQIDLGSLSAGVYIFTFSNADALIATETVVKK